MTITHRDEYNLFWSRGRGTFMRKSHRTTEFQFLHSLLIIKWYVFVPKTYLKSHFQTEWSADRTGDAINKLVLIKYTNIHATAVTDMLRLSVAFWQWLTVWANHHTDFGIQTYIVLYSVKRWVVNSSNTPL